MRHPNEPSAGGPRPRAPGPGAPADPRRILTSVGAVVYDWNIASDRIAWGSNGADVLGLPDLSAWASGASFAEIVEEGDGPSRPDAILGSRGRDDGAGVAYQARYRLRTGPGRVLQVDDHGRWFAGRDGAPSRAHGIMRVSPTDAASGSPRFREREALLRVAAAEIAESRQTRQPLTLCVLAIRDLAELNEELGFEAADAVVDALAERIARLRRQRDRFVRYAGNRFAILLRGCSPDQAEAAAGRLVRLLAETPLPTRPGRRAPRFVVGAASSPDHASDAAGLFRRAEQALGLAKKRSDCPFLLYAPAAFRVAPRGRAASTSALECAAILNGRRIALARQPIVEAGSRRVAFGEALLRVEDEAGRLTAAADVIPDFERSGLVHLADARMLELAADYLAANPGERLALNVSPLTLETGEWLALLGGHLGARPGIAARLIVEVTETAAIRDPAATRRLLEEMKALGVSVAIDDFGAGHTSFRHLRDFPVDLLKIDGVFVQNIGRQASDGFFVRALVDLAQHLGVATVAEWVEDEEAAALLASWGVTYLQGDLFGAPELVLPAPRREVA